MYVSHDRYWQFACFEGWRMGGKGQEQHRNSDAYIDYPANCPTGTVYHHYASLYQLLLFRVTGFG